MQALAVLPDWFRLADLGVAVASLALLTLSGIGYLRLRPWGRSLGTGWAILALAWTCVEVAVERRCHPDAGLSLLHLVGTVYPLLTLVWLQVLLRDVWGGEALAGDGGLDAPLSHPGFAGRLALHLRLSLRQSLRGVSGLLLILFTLGTGLIAVQVLVGVDQLAKGLAGESGNSLPGVYRLGLAGALNGYHLGFACDWSAWASHLVAGGAPIAGGCWLLLALLTPFVACFGSFNLVAADAARRGFRFLLLRTDRDSLYLGRFSGAALLVAATLALLVLCVAVYLVGTQSGCDRGLIALRSFQAWLALSAMALPALALTQALSSLIPSGLGALVLAQLVLATPAALAFSLAAQWKPLWHLMHLGPFGVQLLAFHPDPLLVAGALAACLAYAAVFLWLGLWHFRTRDL